MEGSSALPQLWLHPHQDPCFCTGHAPLRTSLGEERARLLASGPPPPAGCDGWCLLRRPCAPAPPSPPRRALHSRHSFSSLLSKQSGSPSHCQAPGMHRPLLHMKLPGMLHSLVKLFPGSSWLSVGQRGQRDQPARRRWQGPEHLHRKRSGLAWWHGLCG